MAESVEGSSKNYRGKLQIAGATVRLYNKSTGALVSSTTSNEDGRFSIATGSDAAIPFQYFVIAYTTGMSAGITDVEKRYYPLSFCIVPDLVDTNVDLIKVNFPNYRIREVIVTMSASALSNGGIEVRTGANGTGSAIAVSITKGGKYFSNTGDIYSSNYYWIRSTTPCESGGVTVVLMYELPNLILPF